MSRYMMTKKLDTSLLENIETVVEEHISTKKCLPSVEEIAKTLKGNSRKIRKHVDCLVADGRLGYVYRTATPKRAKVVAPKRILDAMQQMPHPPPQWIKKFELPSKKQVLEQKDKVDKELKSYETFEALLWRNGKELLLAVQYALEWLGFQVDWKEELGDQDLDVSDAGYKAIVEVTGSEKAIAIEDLRSLSHYYMKIKYENENENINAILIANPFRHLDLESRKKQAPFTQAVTKAVKKEYSYIRLMTTSELYELIREVLAGNKTKGQAREQFRR